MVFHINAHGDPGPCRAIQGKCPFGSTSQHFATQEEARIAFESMQESSLTTSLEFSNGQWVRRGEVGVSNFLQQVVAKEGDQKRYRGTFEELAAAVKANLHLGTPGTGSENGDTMLVPLDPGGFYTNIVEITPDNEHLVEEIFEARVEGEAPVAKRIIRGSTYAPAKVVNIVVYRADTLAKDDDRSTWEEWEMVAILAQPEAQVPMHPATMERNASNAVGGTKRTYSDEQWAEARAYWAKHAFADEGAASV